MPFACAISKWLKGEEKRACLQGEVDPARLGTGVVILAVLAPLRPPVSLVGHPLQRGFSSFTAFACCGSGRAPQRLQETLGAGSRPFACSMDTCERKTRGHNPYAPMPYFLNAHLNALFQFDYRKTEGSSSNNGVFSSLFRRPVETPPRILLYRVLNEDKKSIPIIEGFAAVAAWNFQEMNGEKTGHIHRGISVKRSAFPRKWDV